MKAMSPSRFRDTADHPGSGVHSTAIRTCREVADLTDIQRTRVQQIDSVARAKVLWGLGACPVCATWFCEGDADPSECSRCKCSFVEWVGLKTSAARYGFLQRAIARIAGRA